MYDHRVKSAIIKTRNPDLFPQLNIPRSTALTWIRKGMRDVVTVEDLEFDQEHLLQKISILEKRVNAETAKNDLVIFTFRIFGLQIQYQRLPKPNLKADILERIKRACNFMPLSECLEAIGMSFARYNNWLKRQVRCLLTDQVSCPSLSPTKLTSCETAAIRDYVISKDLAHYSIPSLAWLAKRQQVVFASLSSWYRVIKEYNLKRSFKRIYPPKPKIGIRSLAPNQIWHLDQTILRLENGSKIYIQAIIDNFSRYVLAWRASSEYGAIYTKDLLINALKTAGQLFPDCFPTVMTDSGCENVNKEVDGLIKDHLIQRLIAQIEINFSNSMIEMFFYALKHRWLYITSLKDLSSVISSLEIYIPDYNNQMPKEVLAGGTPLEVYTSQWTIQKQQDIKTAVMQARTLRISTNKSVACGMCSM